MPRPARHARSREPAADPDLRANAIPRRLHGLMNTQNHDDSTTIAAIATAPGDAGIAIIRVSGPASLAIADKVFRGSGGRPSEQPAGTFHHGFIRETGGERDLEEVVLLVYRAPRSYTREDTVEIQGHGGRTSARRILRAVIGAGADLAEPGEFTQRAFLSGRIDLLQAEAVMDLIGAHTDRAALSALEQLEGRLSASFNGLYELIMDATGTLEVTLDFEEDELPPSVMTQVATDLGKAEREARRLLDTWDEGQLLREGARVVIAGRPNVGKSTLLNGLMGSNRSIVTDVPGTTRDTIEEEIVVNGVPIRLIDTAGLRDVDGIVEKEGIQRARQSIKGADLVLYVLDASHSLDAEEAQQIGRRDPRRTILILNKCDLGEALDASAFAAFATVRASLLQNEGLEPVRDRIGHLLGIEASLPPHATISERHRTTVHSVLNVLNTVNAMLSQNDTELVVPACQELRHSLELLGTVTGKVYSEELLSNIFGRFCIGK